MFTGLTVPCCISYFRFRWYNIPNSSIEPENIDISVENVFLSCPQADRDEYLLLRLYF